MKKFLLCAFAVGLLSLASCSSDETPKQNPNEGQQVLKIRVDDATRRVIDSSEAGNEVQNVKVYVYEKTATGYDMVSTPVLNWNDAVDGVLTYVFPDDKKMTIDATYTIYAIAYEDGAKYGTKYESGAPSVLTDENYDPFCDYYGEFYDAAELDYLGTNKADELFAGKCAEFVAKANSQVAIDLTRQVAGTFFYVKNVPWYDGMESASSITLDLVAGAPLNTSVAVGQFDETRVVNGYKPGSSSTLLSVDLSNWFSAFEQDTEKCTISAANWTGDDAEYVPGSVFASTFFMPMVYSSAGTESLKLVLKVDGVEKHSWVLKLPAAEFVSGMTLTWYYDAATYTFASRPSTESATIYHLLRNHLYTLGNRSEAGDLAVSLYDAKQVLELNLSDDWVVIHTEIDN